VIAANSAQAKGRVERDHGVDQDRLVVVVCGNLELRLAGISTIEDANKFLLKTYLPKMNEKFSRPAKSDINAHVKSGDVNLDDMLCMEFERTISNDVVRQGELSRPFPNAPFSDMGQQQTASPTWR
jgi:hypothetical protein